MDFEVPNYIVSTVEDLKNGDGVELRQISEEIEFPMDTLDRINVAKLMGKFKNQPFYMGMSAPQLGILKRVIVFTKPRNESTDPCRTKVWVNPSYKKVGDKTVEDFECCASVRGVIGPVQRYETISYSAFDIKGNEVAGEATGNTARIIQHEIDHLDGKLFIDFVPDGKLMKIKDFYANLVKNNNFNIDDVESNSDDSELNDNEIELNNNDTELSNNDTELSNNDPELNNNDSI